MRHYLKIAFSKGICLNCKIISKYSSASQKNRIKDPYEVIKPTKKK